MISRAKASAKIILLGEHFVLPWMSKDGVRHLGSSALAVPLPELVTKVEVSPVSRGKEKCHFSLPYAEQAPQSVLPLMKEAIRSLSFLFHKDFSCSVSSMSSFPISRGLGSSASFSVALTEAFLNLSERKLDEEQFLEMAQQIETLFHGKSSGLDTAVVFNSKPVLFEGGKVIRTFGIRSSDLIIVDSGPREGSARWIQKISDFRDKDTKRWKFLTEWMIEKVGQALLLLEEKNGAHELGCLLTEVHGILAEMGLSTEAIETALEVAKTCGCLGGKLSGAGGGGAILLLAKAGDGKLLKEELKRQGLSVLTSVYAKE